MTLFRHPTSAEAKHRARWGKLRRALGWAGEAARRARHQLRKAWIHGTWGREPLRSLGRPIFWPKSDSRSYQEFWKDMVRLLIFLGQIPPAPPPSGHPWTWWFTSRTRPCILEKGGVVPQFCFVGKLLGFDFEMAAF